MLMQILQHCCCCDNKVLCSVVLDPCLSPEDAAKVADVVDKSYCLHLCY